MTLIETPRFQELRIELNGFEGPLDLLLHLIRKHELDILDIPIAFITEEYLKYIDAMEALDLGVAGEYLVMAATLLHIKSRMLLPQSDDDDEDGADGSVGDPREELIRRLLEYQRYHEASVQLGGREIVGRDVYRRPSRAASLRRELPAPDLVPIDLFQLLEAFQRVIAGRPVDPVHEVTAESLSIRDAIHRVADHLERSPRSTLLELVYLAGDQPTRLDVVITFLAVLEMAKLRLVRLFQSRLTSIDLVVERAVVAPEELALRLEGLDEELDMEPTP